MFRPGATHRHWNATRCSGRPSAASTLAGSVRITVELKPEIFYQVLSEQTGLAIGDEAGLMPCIMELARAKREYEKIRSAIEQVEATGYGIVMPTVSELKLEQPQLVRQGARTTACGWKPARHPSR